MSSRSTISVHILTGFLGSGKTTLLNRVLSSSSGFGAETAIIVNEFGDIALDQIFIQERSEETIVLKSGCICCSIRTDLVSTLKQLAAMSDERPSPFKRIVIETSGISDPAPILITLRSDFNLLTRFHVGSTVCVVDATAVGYERAEGMAQLAAALPEIEVLSSSRLSVPEEGKEAFAFALLAYESLHQRAGNVFSATGGSGPAILGKICYARAR